MSNLGNLAKVFFSLCGASSCYPLTKYFLWENNDINEYFKGRRDDINTNTKTFEAETKTRERQEFLQQIWEGGGQ